MEYIMKGDGGSEAAFDDHRQHFPHQLHETDDTVVTYPIGNQDHRLTCGFLHQTTTTEVYIYELH